MIDVQSHLDNTSQTTEVLKSYVIITVCDEYSSDHHILWNILPEVTVRH